MQWVCLAVGISCHATVGSCSCKQTDQQEHNTADLQQADRQWRSTHCTCQLRPWVGLHGTAMVQQQSAKPHYMQAAQARLPLLVTWPSATPVPASQSAKFCGISTLQVQYSDGVVGDLSTAHPSIMSDGTLLNFTRSLPNGGFHIYKQDPHTLKRTEVS